MNKIQNIDLVFANDDYLQYINIKNYRYDFDQQTVWFTDKHGDDHEFHGRWHWYESYE